MEANKQYEIFMSSNDFDSISSFTMTFLRTWRKITTRWFSGARIVFTGANATYFIIATTFGNDIFGNPRLIAVIEQHV